MDAFVAFIGFLYIALQLDRIIILLEKQKRDE